MNILRQVKHHYTRVANAAIEDTSISYRAKGLLVMLLSRPDNWVFRVDWLVKQSKEGRDAVTATLQELTQHGYLKRVPSRGEGGVVSGWDWYVTDDPKTQPLETDRRPEKPSDGKTVRRENRGTGNQGDINKTELTNTDFSNTELASSQEQKAETQGRVSTTPAVVEENPKTQTPKPVESFSPLAMTALPTPPSSAPPPRATNGPETRHDPPKTAPNPAEVLSNPLAAKAFAILGDKWGRPVFDKLPFWLEGYDEAKLKAAWDTARFSKEMAKDGTFYNPKQYFIWILSGDRGINPEHMPKVDLRTVAANIPQRPRAVEQEYELDPWYMKTRGQKAEEIAT